jgi:predicted AAA+ superfamily ATPase
VFDLENAVEAILRNPSEHVPRQRGRPPRWLAALHLLGQIFPTLDVAARRKVLEETAREVLWNAESSSMKVSFQKEALAQYLKERPPASPQMTMRVCKPGRVYR